MSVEDTRQEILIEDDEQQYYEDDDIQDLQEVHQDSYQAVASSSTAESSNRTLRNDNLEQYQHYPVIPRPIKNGASIANRLSDRYTFSFSADLIAQFDNYRAHMRESIRQELETQIIEEEPENDNEETFNVHQVHHEPVESNLQEISTRDRTTEKPVLPAKSPNRQKRPKKFGIPFLRGKSNRNEPTTTRTTTFSDLGTLSSDIDQHQAPRTTTTTTSGITNNEEKSKSSKAKKYFLKIYKLFKG